MGYFSEAKVSKAKTKCCDQPQHLGSGPSGPEPALTKATLVLRPVAYSRRLEFTNRFCSGFNFVSCSVPSLLYSRFLVLPCSEKPICPINWQLSCLFRPAEGAFIISTRTLRLLAPLRGASKQAQTKVVTQMMAPVLSTHYVTLGSTCYLNAQRE